jgi:hypothetical protein
LVPHIRHTRNSRVDPLRLSAEVRVKSAKNDPSMVAAPVSMEIQKVGTIVRQQYPTFGNRQRQNLRIGRGRVRSARVERNQYVVPQASQFRYHLQRNVLVGIKTGH